ncbi:hypothetical protein DPEC_G00112320 [Dallia pectoralis]|uniref:Uncharacterized protein n=1 Tax=Dallia pectoralis TaxID=75939 RepID=A0ACC2GTR0_DALPE|nr:hypothetical protein DPEC_G00112320 [Dallia pectoralis]
MHAPNCTPTQPPMPVSHPSGSANGAAFPIASIARNYLSVFPLLDLSDAFISALELYATRPGARAPTREQQRKRRTTKGNDERKGKKRRAGPRRSKTNLPCQSLQIAEAWLGRPASLEAGPCMHL